MSEAERDVMLENILDALRDIRDELKKLNAKSAPAPVTYVPAPAQTPVVPFDFPPSLNWTCGLCGSYVAGGATHFCVRY